VIVLPTATVVGARHTALVAEHADGSSRAPSRWGYGTERLPATLDELARPGSGSVELPLELAWSGLRVFGLGDVSSEHLVRHWPILRKMLGRGVRETGEEAFPELRRSGAA
jgi:hypothetical protein